MPDQITFKCSKCKEDISVDAALSGFSVACPSCEAPQVVPVFIKTQEPPKTKIRIKQPDQPPAYSPQLHGDGADPEGEGDGEGGWEEAQAEEPSPGSTKKRNMILVGVALLLFGIAGGVFGIRSYVESREQARLEAQRIAEMKARAEALAARELKLQPMWDDAMALSAQTRKLRVNVDKAIKVFEDLRVREFGGTKFEQLAKDEIQRLILLRESVAAEEKALAAKAAEAAKKAEEEKKAAAEAAKKAAEAAKKQQPASKDSAAEAAKKLKASEDKVRKLLPSFAKLAVKGDWKGIFDQIEAAPQDAEAFAGIAPLFEVALNPQKIVLDSLKEDEGKEVTLSLKTGSDLYQINSVRNGNIQVNQKIDRAMIQKNFTYEELSMDERAGRVFKSNPQAASLMLMAARFAKEDFENALAAVVKMDANGKFVAELRGELKKILSDAYAADEYEKLLGRFHLKPGAKNEDIRGEISKLKVNQDDKKDLVGYIDAYKSKFKDFAFLRTISGPLGTLADAVNKIQPQSNVPHSTKPKTDGLGPGIKLK